MSVRRKSDRKTIPDWKLEGIWLAWKIERYPLRESARDIGLSVHKLRELIREWKARA